MSAAPAEDVKPYVFLSYARSDATFVSRLAADLQKSGIDVWRDVEQIAPGTDWEHSILDGLTGASALLYVSSTNSVESTWMQYELSATLDRLGSIIPVVLDDGGAEGLPDFLRAIQWVDFRPSYSRGLQMVLDALPEPLRQPRPIPSKVEISKGYVFVSYAEEDSSFVSDLRAYLRAHSYAYWDYGESDRDYQALLFQELESVIGDAVATLSVLSPAWKKSRLATQEFWFSQAIGKPVFLLRAEPLGPTLAIAGMPYIDFVVDRQAGFSELDRELRKRGL